MLFIFPNQEYSFIRRKTNFSERKIGWKEEIIRLKDSNCSPLDPLGATVKSKFKKKKQVMQIPNRKWNTIYTHYAELFQKLSNILNVACPNYNTIHVFLAFISTTRLQHSKTDVFRNRVHIYHQKHDPCSLTCLHVNYVVNMTQCLVHLGMPFSRFKILFKKYSLIHTIHIYTHYVLTRGVYQ